MKQNLVSTEILFKTWPLVISLQEQKILKMNMCMHIVTNSKILIVT